MSDAAICLVVLAVVVGLFAWNRLSMVVLLAVRLGLPPSKLAMPLAFAGHAGALLVLTGTPINVLVSDAAADDTGRGFGFFEFALVGLPLVAGTIAIAVLFGDRLLPRRVPRHLPPDLSGHARTLADQYGLEAGAVRLRVPAESPAVGAPADALTATLPPGLVVVGALAGDGDSARGTAPLRAGDVLIVRGEEAVVSGFARTNTLLPLPAPDGGHLARALLNRELGLAEVLISPRSGLVGDTVFPGMVTASGDLVILAVQRKGHDLGPAPAVLAIGDLLLVQGTWQALDLQTGRSDEVLVVDPPSAVRRQAVPLGPGARSALAIVVGMVALLATGAVPPAVAGLLAAGAMILLRC